jgi:hypothetical protein
MRVWVLHFLFASERFCKVYKSGGPTSYLILKDFARNVSLGARFLFAFDGFCRVCKSGGSTSYLLLESFAGYVSLGAPTPICFWKGLQGM